jgi:uncharacterized protein with FMN-binding domain
VKTTHPLRRVVLGTAATVSGVVLLLALKPHDRTAAQALPALSPVPSSSAPSSSPSGSASPKSSKAAGGTSGKRTVTGDAVQTRFGPVQVQVALTGSRITAVTVVQVPSDNPRDQEIAAFAVPQLTQEAITAQSARIDTVSGATFTSEGYIQSLQSALDRAGA